MIITSVEFVTLLDMISDLLSGIFNMFDGVRFGAISLLDIFLAFYALDVTLDFYHRISSKGGTQDES